MKTLFINESSFKFDSVIEFKQTETDLLECFFFKGGDLIKSEFLTVSEFNIIKNKYYDN